MVPVSEAGVAGKEETMPEKAKTVQKRLAAAVDYNVIVEKNLFSPDRMANVQDQESQPVAEELKISGEKIMLFGVIMIDGNKSALINNPAKSEGGKDYRWVKAGDRISNLKVVEIQKDRIMLNDGNTEYKISLFDQNKTKPAPAAAPVKEEPKIISTGPTTGSGGEKAAQKPSDTGKTEESDKKAAPKTQEKVKPSEEGEYRIINTPFGKIKKKIK